MFWLAPAVVAVLSVVPVLLGVRRAADEVAALRREMARLAALGQPVALLRDEVRRLVAGAPGTIGRVRPGRPAAPVD